MQSNILKKILRRGRLERYSFISRIKIPAIRRHLELLSIRQVEFKAFPGVAATFQTFNKGHMTGAVLLPFVRHGFKNIIFFADGCVDDTLQIASRKLLAKNHFVISCNNLHEVMTYSIASKIANWVGAEFLLLAQDDDIYPSDFSWLASALELMRLDSSLATIGFNGGYDFSAPIGDSDNRFSTAEYRVIETAGQATVKLGGYYSITNVAHPFSIGGFSFNYVDLIDRAPQLVRMSFLEEVGGWPLQFAPNNYDDIFLCLLAWRRGYKVVHMPVKTITRNVGIGGTRLLTTAATNRRPEHLGRNWHYVFAEFADFVNGGDLKNRVQLTRSEHEMNARFKSEVSLVV